MIDYQIHDISEKKLKFGYWFLKHKKFLTKVPIALLVLFCAITLGYGIFGFASWVINYSKEKAMLEGLTSEPFNWAVFQELVRPQALVISDPQIIFSDVKSYDFVAKVMNPNEDRGVAGLSYVFVSGDYETPISSIVILPGQTVYLLSLSNKSDKGLQSVELKILDIEWQNRRQKLIAENVILETTEPKLHLSGDRSRSWVDFIATNNSLKNIWEVTWQVVLYSGNRAVAVNQILTEEFLSGEERKIELSWFERLPNAGQIDIVPIVDVYNPDNFFEIPGKAGETY